MFARDERVRQNLILLVGEGLAPPATKDFVLGNGGTKAPPYKKYACEHSERANPRLPPGGRDALRKYAGGIFLAKAGSKLCLRPGQNRWRRARYDKVSAHRTSRGLLPSRRLNTIRRSTSLAEGGFNLNRSSRLHIHKRLTVGEGLAPLAVILSGGDN